MRKVIEGRRYDTDTAGLIYGAANSYARSDFRRRSKTLYRTRKGAWFLHHEGGPLSDMAVPVSRGTAGSETIEPVTDRDAQGFLVAHSDDAEAYAALEKYFGDALDDA